MPTTMDVCVYEYEYEYERIKIFLLLLRRRLSAHMNKFVKILITM